MRTGGEEFGPAICGEPKMADFAASASMELFHVGKFGIFGSKTPPFSRARAVFRAGTNNRVNSAPLGVEIR
jgi:hypothetical protein